MKRSLPIVPGFVTLAACLLFVTVSPSTSCASPILYSITGTALDFRGSDEPALLQASGRATLSNEAQSSATPPFNTDSMLRYEVEAFALDVAGIGHAQGKGFLHLEAEGPTWGELGDLAESFRIGFFRRDGSPYPPPNGNHYGNFADYFVLAPIITLETRESGADIWSGVFFDLRLTAVPEPSRLLLLFGAVCAGAAVAGIRRLRAGK